MRDAQLKRGLRNDDMFSIRWVSDPQINRDGMHVAYVVSWLDERSDCEQSEVRVVNAAEGKVHYIGVGQGCARMPRWSPDGRKLAFVSESGEVAAVRLLELTSLSVQRTSELSGTLVAELPGSPLDLQWRPDAGALAVSSQRVTDITADPAYCVEGLPYQVDGQSRPARLMSQLYLLDCAKRRLELLDVGPQSVWHPRWAPTGRRLAFLKGEDPLSQICDIWLLDVTTAERAVRVTHGRGPIESFCWSPTGDSIAYVGHQEGEVSDVNQSLWLASLDNGAVTNLTPDLDRSAGVAVQSDDPRGAASTLAWSPCTGRIYFEVAEGVYGPLHWVDRAGASGTIFGPREVALQPSVCAEHPLLAAIVTTPTSPGDVVLAEELTGRMQQVSHANLWLSDLELPTTELVTAEGDDGARLQGLLVRPVARPHPDCAPPLVVSVHGGPHYAIGWRFNFEHLRLAAKGYVVLAGNPRGSVGYGERFARHIRGGWGDQDWKDVSALVTAVSDRYLVDPHAVAITGVSYGGFMAQWAVARSAKFRAAISENGISNFFSLWGTTARNRAIEVAFGGPPWAASKQYLERSPLLHAASIETPLLLIHAEADRNVPIEQSEQMYVALTRLGREVRFVRLTNEGHLVNLHGRPSRRMRRASEVDKWLARYLPISSKAE